jgi:hypothetical protein
MQSTMDQVIGRLADRSVAAIRDRAGDGLRRVLAFEKRAAAIRRACEVYGWSPDDPRVARFMPIMGASFADSLEAALLDHVLGGGDYTREATVHAGLATASTGLEAGQATSEVPDANGYERVAITNNATNWPAATGTTPTVKENGEPIEFPTATGSWGTVSHAFLASSGTHGANTIIMWGELATPKAITDADTAEFAAGDFEVTLD